MYAGTSNYVNNLVHWLLRNNITRVTTTRFHFFHTLKKELNFDGYQIISEAHFSLSYCKPVWLPRIYSMMRAVWIVKYSPYSGC